MASDHLFEDLLMRPRLDENDFLSVFFFFLLFQRLKRPLVLKLLVFDSPNSLNFVFYPLNIILAGKIIRFYKILEVISVDNSHVELPQIGH